MVITFPLQASTEKSEFDLAFDIDRKYKILQDVPKKCCGNISQKITIRTITEDHQ